MHVYRVVLKKKKHRLVDDVLCDYTDKRTLVKTSPS